MPAVALLELERRPLSAPAAARGRAIERVRAMVANGARPLARGSDGLASAPARLGKLPLAIGGASLLAIGFFAALLLRPSGDRAPARPAARAAAAAATRLRELGLPTPRPRALVDRPAPAQPSPALALGHGLAGYWRFDDAQGSPAARDLSGNANDCTLRRLDANGAWIDGVLGGGITLGPTGWLACPQRPVQLAEPGDLTVAAWIKRSVNRGYHGAIAARQLRDAKDQYFFFAVQENILVLSSAQWQVLLRRPMPEALDRWIHVAFTHRADGATRLFVSGVAVAETLGHPGGEGQVTTPMLVGANQQGTDPKRVLQRFYGAIDELAVYDRALSDEELRALASGEQPRLSP
jgi:hypothetical protein